MVDLLDFDKDTCFVSKTGDYNSVSPWTEIVYFYISSG